VEPPVTFAALLRELGRGATLTDRASLRRLTGDWSGVAQDLEEALGIYRDIGDLGGEVDALNESGRLYLARCDLSQARSSHQQALDLARQTASVPDEALALAGLGRCALAAGDRAEGEILLRQALEIFQRIGAAEAADLLAELDGLTGSRPAV
jgi:tetratricopeptide (TPR) repeat protein